MTITLKNMSGSDAVWGGVVVPNNDSYSVQEVDKFRLVTDYNFLFSLFQGGAVINDGSEDMTPDEATLLLRDLIRTVHEDVQLIPATCGLLGLGAPSLKSVSNSVIGWEFDINDAMYLHTSLDGIIGSTLNIYWHLCINNSIADRWLAYEFHYTLRSDDNTTPMNTQTGIIYPQPILASTTPYQPMEVILPIPISLFDNNRYLWIGVKRITAEGFGKTNTTNNPILLKACKYHKRNMGYF